VDNEIRIEKNKNGREEKKGGQNKDPE